jgi:hypothetical protein
MTESKLRRVRHRRGGIPMMLAGFTGLSLGAGSLAFAAIPDVTGIIYGCCHETSYSMPRSRRRPGDRPLATHQTPQGGEQ